MTDRTNEPSQDARGTARHNNTSSPDLGELVARLRELLEKAAISPALEAYPSQVRWHGAYKPLFGEGRWVLKEHPELCPLIEVDAGSDHHEPSRQRAEAIAELLEVGLTGFPTLLDALAASEARAEKLQNKVTALQNALTPDAGTKAAYIGEFSFPVTYAGEDGEDVLIPVTVPWDTVKAILAAIKSRAAELHAAISGEGR